MQKFVFTKRIIQLASFLVIYLLVFTLNLLQFPTDFHFCRIICLKSKVFSPSLLQASSLWMSNNKRRIDHDLWTDHTSNVVDDFQYLGQQILFLEKLISKVSQPAYNKPIGYQDSRTTWYNEVHSNHFENRISPDYDDEGLIRLFFSKVKCSGLLEFCQFCFSFPDEQLKHRKKIWQASLILGSVGWAFGKLGLISVISPRLVLQDTVTSTSITSMPTSKILTTTTTPTTTTSTTTTTPTTTPTTATTTTTTTIIAPGIHICFIHQHLSELIETLILLAASHLFYYDVRCIWNLQNDPNSRDTSGAVPFHHSGCWQEN